VELGPLKVLKKKIRAKGKTNKNEKKKKGWTGEKTPRKNKTAEKQNHQNKQRYKTTKKQLKLEEYRLVTQQADPKGEDGGAAPHGKAYSNK